MAGETVSSGQRIGGNFSATDWNRVRQRDSRNAVRDAGFRSQAADDGGMDGVVQILNATGIALQPGDIVALSTPPITPDTAPFIEWANNLNFTGLVPSAGYRGRFGVCVGGATAGSLVPAKIWGEIWAQVLIADETHRFCEVVPGETRWLRSSQAGSAQILWAQEGTGARWAYIRIGNYPDELIRFRLTSRLPLGGTATAIELVYVNGGWADSGAEFAITDFTAGPGSWKGEVNAEGWCHRKLDDEDAAEIVWLEMRARFIEFTLTENMGASSSDTASATVNAWWHINDPGSTVKIHDPQKLFTRALSGAKGIAVWDEKRDDAQEGESPDPYYVAVECQSKAGWIRGAITENMGASTTKQATVTVTDFGGSQQDAQEPTGTVIVHDPQDLFKRALSGAKFKAIYDAVEDKYLLVECQTKAGRIRFTLTANISAGSAACDVDAYSGTQQDIQDPGSTETVYDDGGMWPIALDGAKGEAELDVETNKYNIVACQQMTTRIYGVLPAGLATTDASFSVSTYYPMDFSPFNQSPTGTLTIYNVYTFEGDSGARFSAEWNANLGQWELYQLPCPA